MLISNNYLEKECNHFHGWLKLKTFYIFEFVIYVVML